MSCKVYPNEEMFLVFGEEPTFMEILETFQNFLNGDSANIVYVDEVLPRCSRNYRYRVVYNKVLEPLWKIENRQPEYIEEDFPQILIYYKNLFPSIYYPEKNKKGDWVWKRK